MPNYGYRCQSCQREFEVQQRMSDPPEASCPDCGGAGTRLFYPTGILFRGSGFYKTDSRSAAAPTPSPSTDGSKPASDGATPAKPATPAKDSQAPATTSSPGESSRPGESSKPAPPATS